MYHQICPPVLWSNKGRLDKITLKMKTVITTHDLERGVYWLVTGYGNVEYNNEDGIPVTLSNDIVV